MWFRPSYLMLLHWLENGINSIGWEVDIHFAGAGHGRSMIVLEPADAGPHFSRNDFLIVVRATGPLRPPSTVWLLGVTPGSSTWSLFLQLCYWFCGFNTLTARYKGSSSLCKWALTIRWCLHIPGRHHRSWLRFRGARWAGFTSLYICFDSLLRDDSGDGVWGPPSRLLAPHLIISSSIHTCSLPTAICQKIMITTQSHTDWRRKNQLNHDPTAELKSSGAFLTLIYMLEIFSPHLYRGQRRNTSFIYFLEMILTW